MEKTISYQEEILAYYPWALHATTDTQDKVDYNCEAQNKKMPISLFRTIVIFYAVNTVTFSL